MRPCRAIAAIRYRFVCAALALCAGCAVPPVAPDYAREQRWANEITPAIVVGDAVTLKTADGRNFLGILTPAAPAAAAKGAVILVHGVGMHPDFALIGALRTLLAERGYTTLSIQMPVLAADAPAEDYPRATFAEAGERISAAADFLHRRGGAKTALVSHSMGARMAQDWLARNPGAALSAWVPLAISSGRFDGIRGLSFPVFDIYAERDFEQVLAGAKGRAVLLRAIPRSRQAMVYGTDHYFANKEKELAALIASLLDRAMK